MRSLKLTSHLASRHSTPWQEVEAWGQLKAGDKKALSSIYTKYFDSLYDYGTRITRDAGLAEDCIQDLFIELWNKRETLSDVQNIKFYLYKSLRRKIVYQISLKARHPETDDLASFEMELADKTHYLNQQINRDIRQKLGQLIETLTPQQKESIFLIYFDQLSYEEAASVMCLKIKTVYNLVHLAISKLREHKGMLSFHQFVLM
jgi:RNA polymerase sigma factor (sigma-70 family)